MEERTFQSNYIFTLVKFFLFLLIFCFLAEISREFVSELKSKEGFNTGVFYISILAPFMFYTFASDLNAFYRRTQRFFFRTSFFMLLIPSLLVFFSIGFFVLPKVLKFSYNKDIFLFIGGFTFVSHLIFIARSTKGSTFITFINYLFIFSVLYVLNLIIFALYLRVSFNIHIARIVFEGIKGGASLIQTLFSQIFK